MLDYLDASLLIFLILSTIMSSIRKRQEGMVALVCNEERLDYNQSGWKKSLYDMHFR